MRALAFSTRIYLENEMDKKEQRESLGSNHHFKPTMNPNTGNSTKQKWNITGTTQPLQMRIRQNSVSSDGSSPVGSPTEIDYAKLERRNSKTLYSSFGFTN